jgi:acetyl/propionyl-CoA carboxylase alpha subunit
MEMNTRLQVEHPVTEEITGQDLVEWQLRVASGEKLPLRQGDIKMSGHAIEARLYAENPETGFLPSVGGLPILDLPESLCRVEAAVEDGDTITEHYDPMIAKIIAYADTREQALSELRAACADIEVWPVQTNAGFLTRLLDQSEVREGGVDTGFISTRQVVLCTVPPPHEFLQRGAARAFVRQGQTQKDDQGRAWKNASPWSELEGFRVNAASDIKLRVRWRDQSFVVAPLEHPDDVTAYSLRDADYVLAPFEGEMYRFELDTGEVAGVAAVADGDIRAPMPGKVVSVSVKKGASEKQGDALLTLEAMKMEHALTAPFDGTVAELNVKAGAQVVEGALLVKLEKT